MLALSTDPGQISQEQLLQLLELQRRALDIVAGDGELTARMELICRLFEAAAPGVVALVMRREPSGRLRFACAPGVPEAILAQLDDVMPGPDVGSCAHAVWSGQPSYVGDALSDPRTAAVRPVVEQHGIRACWSSPIRTRTPEVVGTFALIAFEPRLPGMFHRKLMELGASAVGLLLDQEQASEQRVADESELRRMALVAARVPAGALITDHDGRIQWTNDGMVRLSGLDLAGLIGRLRGEVLRGERTDPGLLDALHQAIAAGRDFHAVLVNYRRDGHPYTVQLTSTPLRDPNGRCEGAVLMEVDISASRRLSDFNALLAEVTDCVANHDDERLLLQRICELAVSRADLKLAWIGRPASDGWFEYLASAGPAIGYMQRLRVTEDPSLPQGNGASARTWREGRSYYNRSFAHTAFLAPWQALAAEFGIAASATLPIRRAGVMWAVLTVYHAEEEVFDTELRVVLEALASSISRGLDRIDLMRRERETQSLNLSMLNSTTVGVILLNQRRVARANDRAANLLGAADPHELIGLTALDLYADRKEGEGIPARIADAFARSGRAVFEVPARRLDGGEVWLRIEGTPFEHEGFDQIWSLVDITEQREAVASQALMARALASVKEGVVISDASQRTVYINQAFEEITGYGPEEMRGRTCGLLQGEDTDAHTRQQIREALHAQRSYKGEVLNYHKHGAPFWNLLTITPLHDAAGELTHFVGVQRNIDDIRALRDRLEHLAFHDDLTGLPNRRELDRYLPEAIAAATEAGQALAIGKIDLDDFKAINDTWGHAVGDQMLARLAARMVEHLHAGDLLVRVGGDEFVVVFEGLPRADAHAELERRVARLGEAFAGLLVLSADIAAELTPSMGLALLPTDGSEGGNLLRAAEEALYQAKRRKHERTRWWLWHGAEHEGDGHVEQSLDAYGADAAALLRKLQAHLDAVLGKFIEHFYRRVGEDAQASAILDSMLPAEIDHLRERQTAHLRMLTDADVSREQLARTSDRLGRVHALVGVDSVYLVRWMAVYREMLSNYFNALPMRARERYQLVQLVEQRIQDDMQGQLQAQSQTQAQFVALVMQALPGSGASWNSTVSRELAELAQMPGIACAMVLRQSSQGVFSIEASAGGLAQPVASLLAAATGYEGASTLAPPPGSLLLQAWESASISTSPSLAHDRHEQGWGALSGRLADLGIRTAVHVPVLDAQGLPVALLTVMGQFPHQFASPMMQQFNRNLQQRWSEIWQRSARPPPPVSQEQAIVYRDRLFKGGLVMHVQPVIDLHDGRLCKVEALARLMLEDGSLVAPDTFIPLLRHAELDRLFVLGLDAALAALVEWEQQGLVIGVALNLPPQTLVDPACATWVAEALGRHRVAADRLTLEVLESQRLDELVRDAGVERLIGLGVQLAMDDLGSGYSSLRRLASLPFSSIKVDQDLLKRLRQEPCQTISLVSAVIQMGRDFGCDVVVEGLEDRGMIEVARLLGARYGQGFGLARPMPCGDLVSWSLRYCPETAPAPISTVIAAVAFQWWSVRHRPLHGSSLETCPMTAVLAALGDEAAVAVRLHQCVHRDPQDDVAARDLLDGLESLVRASVRSS
ncbi:MAG TPA: EAL domain-containing protein [Dyella sp.]|nr:EAL domain-containing protein [Dyella sp.]